MALIFFLSSGPAPAAAARYPDWLTHGAGYAVLGGLAARALDATAPWAPAARAAGAVALASAYGVTDELHQSTVAGRQADPRDVAFDAMGSVAGVLAWRVARRGGRR
jgi:VanZ family protein